MRGLGLTDRLRQSRFGRRNRRKQKRIALRTRQSHMERLENRLMLSVQSPPTKPLPTGSEPLDIQIAPVNADPLPDLAVLGTGGQMTIALNGGNDTWSDVTTVDLAVGSARG